MTKNEKKILYKLYKYLWVPGVTNPCDVRAITDYINETKEKIKNTRKILKDLCTKGYLLEELKKCLDKELKNDM